MSSESSTGDRNRVPDVIPDHLLRDHLDQARDLVVASHYLRNLPHPTRLELLADRIRGWLDSNRAPAFFAVLAVALACMWLVSLQQRSVSEVGTWLFASSALTTVLAILFGVRWGWRKVVHGDFLASLLRVRPPS